MRGEQTVPEKVIALIEQRGALSMAMLVSATGMDRTYVSKFVRSMVACKQLRRCTSRNDVVLYYVAEVKDVEAEQDSKHIDATYLHVVHEAKMRHTLHMVKRMKDCLIEQWHPLLDQIAADYAISLDYFEASKGD